MFVILLNHKNLISVKKEWIEYPILSTISKIFFSPDRDAMVNFKLPLMQVFDENQAACYMGLVCRQLGMYPYTFVHSLTEFSI